MIKFYKTKGTMAILTDAKDEFNFIHESSQLISNMIHDGMYFVNTPTTDDESIKHIYENDWAYQLNKWLPQIVDICCKFRGYKNNVKEERLLVAGDLVVCEDTMEAEYYPESYHGNAPKGITAKELLEKSDAEIEKMDKKRG